MKRGIAINWFGFAALSHFGGDPQVRGKVGVAPVPRGEPGRLVSLNVYWLYAVGSGSPKKQAAYDFIRFAVRREKERLLSREGGIGCRSMARLRPGRSCGEGN